MPVMQLVIKMLVSLFGVIIGVLRTCKRDAVDNAVSFCLKACAPFPVIMHADNVRTLI